MAGSAGTGAAAGRSGERNPLWGTLPLLTVTVLLFVGAFVLLFMEPRAGAGRFPLWSLLFTLGIVAAIGSTISWFYAEDEAEPESIASGVAPVPTPRRSDFGRPLPEVGGRPAPGRPVPAGARDTAPWDEDVLPPVVAHGPRPVLTTLDDPGEIGRALEEIAEIQRQLATRRPAAPTAAAAIRGISNSENRINSAKPARANPSRPRH